MYKNCENKVAKWATLNLKNQLSKNAYKKNEGGFTFLL